MPCNRCCCHEYELPPLRYHEHIIPASHGDARKSGLLFAEPAKTLNEQRAARRGSLESRVAVAAEIARSASTPVILWCDLNSESEALAKAIPGSVEVTGSMSDDEKESAIEAFVSGRARVCVSKPSLMGFGLNMQFARTAAFCGVTHSFEAYYQAVRRSWRFGVDGDVDVHIISSELEGNVVENLKRKAAAAEELSNETRRHVAAHVREAVTRLTRETIAYRPTVKVRWPSWLATEEA